MGQSIFKAASRGVMVMALALAACGGSDSDGGDAGAGAVPPVLTTIVLTPSDAIVGIGQTKAVTAEARDQSGAAMSGIDFTWASSNAAVGSVAGGVATGIAAGTTDITASSGGVASKAVRLTVVAVKKASVVVDRPGVFLAGVGETSRLAAQAFDAAGAASGAPLTWTSSAPDKVSVDASGQVVALAIGSAQVRAESNGVKSAPTLVVVAKPKAGTLLLRDADIVSVGAPLVAAGTFPGVGSTYEVALRSVTSPLPGTIVLAAESAPVAGKVVSVRSEAAGPVLTLAVTPLYDLLEAYDIRFSIALADFEVEAASLPAPSKVRPRVLWGKGSDVPRDAAATGYKAAKPFGPFACEPELEVQLLGKTTELALEGGLNLVVEDRPGYSKHAIEGTGNVVGKAGLKLKGGFKAKGDCRVKAQVKIPVFGWFSAFVMPGISFGLGVEVEGEVLLVQGDLGVEGTVGFAGTIGWECGGATPDCRSLNNIEPNYKLKTKSKIPSENDPQAKVSAHFYMFAGLDAVFALGLGEASLVEAKLGPKQSFDMAFEKHQAARPEYASSYELTFEGVIEPGASLKAAIKKLIDSDTTGLSLQATFGPTKLSESPKGTLTIDKARVRPDATANFSVDLDDKTVRYFLLGYNVTGLELWRKRSDELEFSFWKYMEATGSNPTNFRYAWKPTKDDVGSYEFAAFVSTKNLIEVVPLEIKENSKQPLEVQCFSGGKLQAKGAPQLRGPAACFDTYEGTSFYALGTPGNYLLTANAAITWIADPARSSPTHTTYKVTGRVDVAFTAADGCTRTLVPSSFAIVDPMSGALNIDTIDLPTTYGFGGALFIDATLTKICPDAPPEVDTLRGYPVTYAAGMGSYTGQATLAGNVVGPGSTSTWNFVRP